MCEYGDVRVICYVRAGAPREILGRGAKISFGPLGQWCSKIKR